MLFRSDGLADIPPVPSAVRESVRARWESLGPRAFHAEVARVDPVLGARLAMRDRQRLMRALEVYEATGRPLSEWQKSPTAMPGMEARVIVLDPPREAHKAACDARFLHMVEQGALAEVRVLLALGLDPDLPVMKALGVRELAAHAAGSLSLDSAIAAAQRATRAYAKRQRTWFRHQLVAEAVFESPEAAEAALLQRGITGGR